MPTSEQPQAPSRPLAALALRLGFAGLVLGLFAAVTQLQGCKAGADAACRCADDCRGGLICQAVGKAPLDPNACAGDGEGCCYPAETPGFCGEADESAESDGMLTAPSPDDNFDASKRDLAGPDDGESDGGSSGSTTSTMTSDASATTMMTSSATQTTSGTTQDTTSATETSTTATTSMETGTSTDSSGSSTSDTGTGTDTDTDTDTDTN